MEVQLIKTIILTIKTLIFKLHLCIIVIVGIVCYMVTDA